MWNRARNFISTINMLVWKNIKLGLSYRFNLLLKIVWLAGLTFGFYFLSKTFEAYIPPMLRDYGGYFPFVLIGYSFVGLQGAGLGSPSSSIRDEQVQGTLELLLANGASPLAIATSGAITSYLRTILNAVVLILIGLALIGGGVALGGFAGALIVLILSSLAYFGLGLMGCGFILTFKRGNPVLMAYSGLAYLVSGVYFPYHILPVPLQIVAKAIPLTYTLDGLRKSLLLGLPVGDIWFEIVVLAGMVVVFLPLGFLSLRLSTVRAKRDASLTQY